MSAKPSTPQESAIPPVAPSIFVRQVDMPEALGLSRAGYYRVRHLLPRPVSLPGVGVVYRRSDLERWAANLKPARPRRRQPAEVANA